MPEPTTADIVNIWFSERLATGAIARNTEAYNQAAAAVTELIARLSPAPAPAADAAPATPKAAPAKADTPAATPGTVNT